MPRLRITKAGVESIPPSPSRTVIYRDSLLVGFGLRVSGSTKSYIVEKRVAGKTVRTKLGRHPQISCDHARRLASAQLGLMTTGVNPNHERRAVQARTVTLEEAVAEYLGARPNLRASTVRGYEQAVRLMFNDWKARPIASITKDMVTARHAKAGRERGGAFANLGMRVLRAVLNFASHRFEDAQGMSVLPENPVQRLSTTKTWFKISRRRGVIAEKDMTAWIQAVRALGSEPAGANVRDYLLLLLFTGLRRQEAARLRWQDVDLKDRTLTIPDTKNGEPLTLPLSTVLVEILERRHGSGRIGYVFPGTGATGHIVEPKRQLNRVRAESGIEFMIHDLRRTFITVAESLDISSYAVKRLVNHKMSGDVTAGYVVSSVDRLRDPMQRIADRLMELEEGARFDAPTHQYTKRVRSAE